MASLADYPGQKKPWWTDTCWYRCRICKACFQFPEALLKHKEKHLSTANSDSDHGETDEDPHESSDLRDDGVNAAKTQPNLALNSSVEPIALPAEPKRNVTADDTVDSCEDEDNESIDKRPDDDSPMDPTTEDEIILPDPTVPSNIMRCNKSQNSGEEVEVEEDSSPVRELRKGDSHSQKSDSSLVSATKSKRAPTHAKPVSTLHRCPFCRVTFSSQRLKENHVENCEVPFNFRRKAKPKRARKQNVNPNSVRNSVRTSKISVLRKQPKRKASSCNSKKSSIVGSRAIRRIKEVKARALRKFIHRCHVCQEVLPTQQSLQIHIQQHLVKEKPFVCNICKSRFVTKPGLTKHLITKHSKFRNYELSNS